MRGGCLGNLIGLVIVIVIATLTGVVASQQAGIDAHSAIEPVPRTAEWWKNRHAGMNERVAKGNVDVIFIGDSITQGWETAGKDAWAKHFAPRNAVNLGISGDRTQHVLWRLANGNIDGISPKVAVIMIGTNNSNGSDNTATEIADGITAIVHTLMHELPDVKILLLDVFPRGQHPNPQRGKILQVNQIVRKLAAHDRLIYLPIGHHFVNADGSIPKDIMPDFLHLSPKGYTMWAEAIDPTLAAMLGERPG